ncbi:MAG: hypothetical protein MUE51_13800 [Thermoleophilia bacterium]|nr:hypothetical protein [Thermoleophilia bacterium]
MKRPSASMVVAVTALSVALGGTATAAKLITGAQIRNGTITRADLAPSLRADLARPAVQSVAGPQGLPGPAGPQGPAGAPGPAGVNGGFDPARVAFRVGPDLTVWAGDLTSLSVSCLPGETAISGGFVSTMGYAFSDHPGPGGTSWTILVDNLDGLVDGIGRGYVVCARA